MRLLERTQSGALTFTGDLADAELPPYAILSHTWGLDDHEVKYCDIVNGTAVSKPGFDKVLFCAEQAKKDRLNYFWVDSCCIDKSNHSELSEAIVSMFRWYSKAAQCYAFLSDVPASAETTARADVLRDFQASRWFTRGWTLQELLAPSKVTFFTRHGTMLGTKCNLWSDIVNITHIPAKVFQEFNPSPLHVFPVAKRLSWQDNRETKRPEDKAYSMLGIFDVSMPIIYGEGSDKALTRLRREIDIQEKRSNFLDYAVSPSLLGTARVQHFVGRTRELQELEAALHYDGSRKTVVLHGLGGMGKTQLALQYAHVNRDIYSAICWLNFETKGSARSSYVEIAKRISSLSTNTVVSSKGAEDAWGFERPDVEEANIIDAVMRWFCEPANTRWLMLVDNYDNPSVASNRSRSKFDMRKYLPPADHGTIVVTTRSAFVRLGHCIKLEKLENLAEGIEILQTSSNRKDLDKDPNAEQVAQALDGLPLALATAGAYINRSSMSLEKYLHLYKTSWTKLLASSTPLETYDRKLYSTWDVTFRQIEDENSQAATLLRLLSYFGNERVWFGLLKSPKHQTAEWNKSLVEDELDFENAAQLLCGYGLLEKLPATSTIPNGYSLHRCVYSWARSVLERHRNHSHLVFALCSVAQASPRADQEDWWVLQRLLLNHANSCWNEWKETAPGEDLLGNELWAYSKLARLFHDQGKLSVGEEVCNLALLKHEKVLASGETVPSTVETIKTMGVIYLSQNKAKKAATMCLRGILASKAIYGADHRSTLEIVNNLGMAYRKQGKFELAERAFNRAIRGYERSLGHYHTSTLIALNNLASLHGIRRDADGQEKMYKRALEGFRLAVGNTHSLTLTATYNLSALYLGQGKLVEAEDLGTRALSGFEKIFGAGHKSTADAAHNLSLIYLEQGRLQEGEHTCARAIEAYERALGAGSNSFSQASSTFCSILRAQGKDGLKDDYTGASSKCDVAPEPFFYRTLDFIGMAIPMSSDLGSWPTTRREDEYIQ